MKKIVLALCCFGVSACAYPTSSIEQRTPAAQARLSSAPVGAALIIDGVTVGYRTSKKADLFEVQPGRHLVQVSSGGRSVSSQEYFFGPGSVTEIGTSK